MTPNKVLVGQVVTVFAIVIGGTWITMQWTASQLGYQLRLGSPWFVEHAFSGVDDVQVYYPWRLFQRCYVYEAYAPRVFVKG
jgi:type IV secretion system protein VirD4